MKAENVYYRVDDGEALALMDAHIHGYKEFADEALAWAEKNGGNGHLLLNRGSTIAGVCFDETPDSKLWKDIGRGAYVPKKNTKIGKALFAEMEAIKGPGITKLMESFGLPCHVLYDGNQYFGSGGVFQIDDVFYISSKDFYGDKAPETNPVDGLTMITAQEYHEATEAAKTKKATAAANE